MSEQLAQQEVQDSIEDIIYDWLESRCTCDVMSGLWHYDDCPTMLAEEASAIGDLAERIVLYYRKITLEGYIERLKSGAKADPR